jgi:hypothetical protein
VRAYIAMECRQLAHRDGRYLTASRRFAADSQRYADEPDPWPKVREILRAP